MIKSSLFWRLFAGGVALLAAGLLLGSALASGRIGPAATVVVALLLCVAVLLAAGQLTRRARNVLARAAELGLPLAPREEVCLGDEFARLDACLEANKALLVEQVEQLTAERNQLTAVLGGMVEGVVAIDRHERVLHLNAVAAEWFGWNGSESVLGRPIHDLSRQPEIAGALVDAMENGVQTNRAFAMALAPGQNGGPSRFELNASPLVSARRDREQIEGAVAVIHDTTELERLEGVRRDFVSNVSHELKTPLTAIRGYVETLLEVGPVDALTRGRFLRKIRRQSDRLSALVSDLLTLSRIESSTGPLTREVLDLRSLADEVLNLLRPATAERGIELVADFPEEAVVVLGEEEPIRQALSNLVDNAAKYSATGGRVLVRLQALNGRAMLEVEDDGPGIAGEHQDRIFERFYRVDRARSRELGGTGLGLAIVKNVASGHGGGVEVESEPGAGSTFRLWLPTSG